MIRYITSGANELDSGHARYIAGASIGDLIVDQAQVQGFYIDVAAPHSARNFSLGVGSLGYTQHLSGVYTTSPAYNNFYSNGVWKNNSGAGSGNYTGAIGSRLWFDGRHYDFTVTSSGGNALFTRTDGARHGYLTSGVYAYITSGISQYAGYKYIQVISTTTFKIRDSVSGGLISYFGTSNEQVRCSMGASKMIGLDIHGDADNKVTITNCGKWTFRKTPESNVSYGFELWGGATHWKYTDKYDPINNTGDINYQGYRGNRLFSRGTYGIEHLFYNDLSGNTCVNIKNQADFFEIDGTEIDGGGRSFAGLQIKNDSDPTHNMTFEVHDVYVHDTEGEGFYWGNTGDNVSGSSPSQHWINFKAYNNRACRTGVEIFQLGQLHDGCEFHNNVGFLADVTHFAPFFSSQSSTCQTKPRSGQVDWGNNVIDGGCIQGLIMQSNRADEVLDATKSMRFYNSLFINGRGRFAYNNMFGDGVMPVVYENIYIKNLSFDNEDGRSESQPDPSQNEIFRLDDVTTEFFIKNKMVIDVGMTGRNFLRGGNIAQWNIGSRPEIALPDPQYVASGYEYIPSLTVHQWFAKTNALVLITYTNDWMGTGYPDILLYKGLHYEVLTVHSGTTSPDADSTNCRQIFWDSAGKSDLDPAYNGTPYSAYPPDDLRLQANSYYNKLGMGLFDNEDNDERTYITWEANSEVLHEFKDLNELVSELPEAVVTRNIYPVDTSGTIGAPKTDTYDLS